MAIGAAALAGVPGFAGFFSKDEILSSAFQGGHTAVWALLLLGAFFTAYYTFRLLFLAFLSGPRMSKDVAHHAHESPGVMTLPLVVLAVLTVVAGWAVGVPSEHGTRFERFLAPVLPAHEAASGGVSAYIVLVLSVAVVAAGIILAWMRYVAQPVRPDVIGHPRTALHRLLLNAYGIDWLYERAIVRPLYALSRFAASVVDQGVIDGAVNLTGRAVLGWAAGFRRLQTGYIMNYALTMLVGAVVLVAFLLSR
jgi:NADH-quinone oxidoreductase subunit L